MIKPKIFLFHLISFLIILNTSGLFAQEKMSIGISSQMLNTRFLVNVSNFQTKGTYRPTSILFTEYDFGKKYCVHTGIGYSMMTQNSDAFRNNFHYLIMPLHFKIGRLKENQRIVFAYFSGVNLHYLFRAQHIFLNETQMDIMDQSRKFHFDLVVGGGLKFRMSDNFSLEALTNFSLGYFVNKRNAAHMDINNFNSGLTINLSYKLK